MTWSWRDFHSPMMTWPNPRIGRPEAALQKGLKSMKMTILFFAAAMVLLSGCKRDGEKPTTAPTARRTVTLYTAIDEEYAKKVVEQFEKASGIQVLLRTDGEANKTSGLSAKLMAERDNPRADVWWSNEPFFTINLAEAGAFAPYESPEAKRIPSRFRDPQNRWTGNGLRQRMIALTLKEEGAAARDVRKLSDLLDPKLKGRIAMGPPGVGTIGGQVAAIYLLWGDQKGDDFFKALKANGLRVATGNGHVTRLAAEGTIWAGLTDNDDVASQQAEGGKIVGVTADLDGGGALMIPTSIAMVAGCRHPDLAKTLIDYLLSAEVEKMLADGRYLTKHSIREPLPPTALEIDYVAAAKLMPGAIERVRGILE